MGIINEAKSGADLTHPRPSIGYVFGAVVAVVILMLVFGIGGWLYRKATNTVGAAGNGAVSAGNALAGAFGSGNS